LAGETGWKKNGEDYPIADLEGMQVVESDESSTRPNVLSHSLDWKIQSLLAKPHRKAAPQSHVSSTFSEFPKSLGSLLIFNLPGKPYLERGSFIRGKENPHYSFSILSCATRE